MIRLRTAARPYDRARNRYRLGSVVAVILGVCPPLVCALAARNSSDWDLFERSGSISAAIGLAAASRRYMQHSILELIALHENGDMQSDLAEVLEDISTGKLGLALSGFGIVIWGWGKYLEWWSFGYLVVWGYFIVRDARRDLIRQQLRSNRRSGPRLTPKHPTRSNRCA